MKAYQFNLGDPGRSNLSYVVTRVSSSISAVNGSGGSDHVGAHAWWTDFLDLASGGSQQRNLVHSPHLNASKVKSKSKSSSSWPKFSDATSPQVQIVSLAEHLQVDGDMVRHTPK